MCNDETLIGFWSALWSALPQLISIIFFLILMHRSFVLWERKKYDTEYTDDVPHPLSVFVFISIVNFVLWWGGWYDFCGG